MGDRDREGDTVILIARAAPEMPDYYYVVGKATGRNAGRSAGSSTITGSTAGLPVRETPPLPTVNFVIRNHINHAVVRRC